MTAQQPPKWIEFVPIPGTEKVRCPKCGRAIGHQRMARGAHAAWHARNDREVTVRLADSADDPTLTHLEYPECAVGEPHLGSTCPVWRDA